MDLQILVTDRLRLEPLQLSHADQLFKLFQDPELYQWITKDPPTSLEAFRNRIRFLEKLLSRDKMEYWLNWVFIEKATNQIAGQVEISLSRESLNANLAYYTFKNHQRRGCAKEACRAVIDHIFEKWQARKILIETDTRNLASVRLAESLGAKRVTFKENTEFFKGVWSDEFRYELSPKPLQP